MAQSDRDISFVLGEIVGTQKQILKIVEDNAEAIIDQNKRIDCHRAQTLKEFEENRRSITEQREALSSRYDRNAGRIDKLEQEVIKTKGFMKGILWLAGLVVPVLTWILRKLEIL